jgi:hypothetical protein
LFTADHSFVVITQIFEHTVLALGPFPDADITPMTNHVEMKIPIHVRVAWQEGRQEFVGFFWCDLRADKPQALADAMDMRINRQDRFMEIEKQYQ